MSPLIGFAPELAGHPEIPAIFEYAWLEGTLRAVIARLEDAPDWRDLESWPSGRLFGKKGEYRWQRGERESIHGVILLDEDPIPHGFEGQLELEPVQNGIADLILWGEWVDPDRDRTANPEAGPLFFSPQIPNIQKYPIEPDAARAEGAAPRLVTSRYRHKVTEDKPETFMGEFIRCAGFCMKGERQR